MLLKAEPPPLHSERQLAPRRDYEVLHSGHTDWVTHLQHIPGGWVGGWAWRSLPAAGASTGVLERSSQPALLCTGDSERRLPCSRRLELHAALRPAFTGPS